jgi:hypothetical protein
LVHRPQACRIRAPIATGRRGEIRLQVLKLRIVVAPQTSEAFQQQDKTLRRYLKPDPVIIDDMGLKALPKQSGEYLLEVIMRRYENRATIMTSNHPLEDWGKLLSDVPTAEAILDRVLHHAITITITGRSYRVKDAPLAGPEPKKKRPAEAESAASQKTEPEKE